MATANLTTIANAAARFLGVIDSGGSLSSTQLDDALAAANNMLDNWSSQRLYAISETVTRQNLAANTGSYTIGPAATWNIARPAAITAASHVLTVSGNEFATSVQILNANAFMAQRDRRSTSLVPQWLYYDRGNPTGNVYLGDVPAVASAIDLVVWTALTQFADKTTAITMLPGYQRAIEHALAFELAPQYDITPTDSLVTAMKDALATIRNLNASLLGPEPPQGQVIADAGAPIASPSGSPGSN